MISATSLDTIRIESLGEGRAVTCPGNVWLEFRDKFNEMQQERDAALKEVGDLRAEITGLRRISDQHLIESRESASRLAAVTAERDRLR